MKPNQLIKIKEPLLDGHFSALEDSAKNTLSLWQVIGLVILAIVIAFFAIIDPLKLIIVLFSIIVSGFIIVLIHKAYYSLQMHLASVKASILQFSKADLLSLKDKDLPFVTVMVPTLKDHEILPRIIQNMSNLDYPKNKLEVMLILEEVDKKSLEILQKLEVPENFKVVIVPDYKPRTKGKALNHGLCLAKGEIIGIYDAEDQPEVDQIKKIILGFSKLNPKVVCIQARLAFYNQCQNILTQWFTIEYLYWFNLFLPELSATKQGIPLGGTSCFFKKDKLLEVGAWDPYNVTEDADLGIRIYRKGYETEMVYSVTWEEATSRIGNWIKQRSRWMKGYIQTSLVHSRNPIAFLKQVGLRRFLNFTFTIPGTVLLALYIPIGWTLTIYFVIEHLLLNPSEPLIIFMLAFFSLVFGNMLIIYFTIMAAMQTKFYDLVKNAISMPIYWLFMSAATWKALQELILFKSHLWAKTKHGQIPGLFKLRLLSHTCERIREYVNWVVPKTCDFIKEAKRKIKIKLRYALPKLKDMSWELLATIFILLLGMSHAFYKDPTISFEREKIFSQVTPVSHTLFAPLTLLFERNVVIIFYSCLAGLLVLVSSIFIYRLLWLVSNSRIASTVGLLVFALNPQIPRIVLANPVILFWLTTFIAAIYYFTKYVQTDDHWSFLHFTLKCNTR